MDQTTQQTLIDRIQVHLETRGTDCGPSETRWPVEDYYDKDRYQREVERIFHRYPIIVGHVSQLQRPGDFLTESVCGVPVVVNRTPAGAVNAFLNVCRHRGARLVDEACGSRLHGFVCPYHAWTYDPDGKLRQVPDRENSFPGVDLDGVGLVPVPVEVRHGFVWVTFRPGGARGQGMAVSEHLGAIGPELESYGMEGHVVYRQEAQQRAFNWKCGIEGFLENYHFAVLHKNSTNRIFVHNVAAIDGIGGHIRAVAPKRTLAQLDRLPDDQRGIRPNATILYTIFPNACLFVEKNHASLLQVFPEEAERSRVKLTHVVRYDSLKMRPYWDENIRVFMSAALEDLMICESMQQGFRSGANRDLLFGRNELGCHLFRQRVEEAVQASE